MLKDDQPVTSDDAANIVLLFKQFRDESKMSLDDVGKALGYSGPVLSEVMRGRYAGDTEGVLRRIDAWMAEDAPNLLASIKRRTRRRSTFIQTEVAEEIFDYAAAARREGIIVYFAAPAGTGKTMALKAIEQRTVGAIYTCCLTKVDTAVAFFRQLCEAVGVNAAGTLQQMIKSLVSKLKDSNRLLLIDQVHKLLDRRKDEALLALGDLHDLTECPMLLVGTRSVLDYLREHNTRDPVEQFDSRVKLRRDLTQKFALQLGGRPGGKPIFTPKQMVELMDKRGLALGPGASQLLSKVANKTRGHLRIVDAILSAISLTNGARSLDVITVDQITDAIPHVMGRVLPELLPGEDDVTFQIKAG